MVNAKRAVKYSMVRCEKTNTSFGINRRYTHSFSLLIQKETKCNASRSQFHREESQRPRLDEKLVYNFDHVPRTKRK